MRGTPANDLKLMFQEGIIPAYAGNTGLQLVASNVKQDHPRVCGEHGMADIGDAFNSGSSPRMRGTLR